MTLLFDTRIRGPRISRRGGVSRSAHSKRVTLPSHGFPKVLAVEHKPPSDLAGCIGASRERFERVGNEATKSTLARMGKQEPEPPKELNPDELALTYGLEPTTIQNLKATRRGWEKTLGRKVTLEEACFLEFAQLAESF